VICIVLVRSLVELWGCELGVGGNNYLDMGDTYLGDFAGGGLTARVAKEMVGVVNWGL
jgi:hypothetical protein